MHSSRVFHDSARHCHALTPMRHHIKPQQRPSTYAALDLRRGALRLSAPQVATDTHLIPGVVSSEWAQVSVAAVPSTHPSRPAHTHTMAPGPPFESPPSAVASDRLCRSSHPPVHHAPHERREPLWPTCLHQTFSQSGSSHTPSEEHAALGPPVVCIQSAFTHKICMWFMWFVE